MACIREAFSDVWFSKRPLKSTVASWNSARFCASSSSSSGPSISYLSIVPLDCSTSRSCGAGAGGNSRHAVAILGAPDLPPSAGGQTHHGPRERRGDGGPEADGRLELVEHDAHRLRLTLHQLLRHLARRRERQSRLWTAARRVGWAPRRCDGREGKRAPTLSHADRHPNAPWRGPRSSA